MWIRLNPKGEFSNPHTEEKLPEPEPFTLLRAIRGHAGSDPEPGNYVCLGEGRFIGIYPNSGRKIAENIIDTRQLCRTAWAVVNNGYAFFSIVGKLEF